MDAILDDDVGVQICWGSADCGMDMICVMTLCDIISTIIHNTISIIIIIGNEYTAVTLVECCCCCCCSLYDDNNNSTIQKQ